MNRFAVLLDALAYEPRRNAKLRLITDFLATTPDPERGFALAAITGSLVFRHAKAGLIRDLVIERVDAELFALSYDYVGDLSETVALIWPRPVAGVVGHNRPPAPGLADVVEALATTTKSALPRLLAGWMDGLDEKGRWALLKLITGGLRIGVSARLAKTAVAGLGTLDTDEIEDVWPGLAPPYTSLFAWAEGKGPRPEARDPVPFRPPMLAHPLDDGDLSAIAPETHMAEWKWDGIRVQAAGAMRADGTRAVRLYSRSGDDISAAFPDVIEAITFDAVIDGELLVVIEGVVQSFNALQQRLNRKQVTAAMLAAAPAHIRAYDLLVEAGEDLRALPFEERRARLERFVAATAAPRIDLSPLVGFSDAADLAQARALPSARVSPAEAVAIEGLMIKRRDAPYLPGRPKGLWFKWKRDPMLVDCVLMYAQRGHGKRSSYYSDFTFGVWRGESPELVPVGKAYFGFTDEELLAIDRFVRNHTINRFGPVREVTHTAETGLVFEVAFEGLARSGRHKSGLAMRFPRISRLRWDKKPAEADRIEVLERLIAG